MIELIQNLPAGTVGFRARGQVTARDYEEVIVPDVEAAFAIHRKLRLLYITEDDFTGFDPLAMWDDAKLSMRHLSGWERVALVSDVEWLRTAMGAMRFVLPVDIRVFRLSEEADAQRWIVAPAT